VANSQAVLDRLESQGMSGLATVSSVILRLRLFSADFLAAP
jgi:hypothetical protein